MRNPIYIFISALMLALGTHIYTQGGWPFIQYKLKQLSVNGRSGLKKEIHYHNIEDQLRKRALRDRLNRQNENFDSKKNNAKDGFIYTWTDDKGQTHASNVAYPADNDTLKITKELNPHENETPIQRKGNNILIPVTLGNQGKEVTVEMIFDTGAHDTVVHESLARQLSTKPYRTVKRRVADGRDVTSKISNIDYIKVGPYTVTNFTVCQLEQANVSRDKGLLGMSFLQNHPFEIDLKRNIIKWL